MSLHAFADEVVYGFARRDATGLVGFERLAQRERQVAAGRGQHGNELPASPSSPSSKNCFIHDRRRSRGTSQKTHDSLDDGLEADPFEFNEDREEGETHQPVAGARSAVKEPRSHNNLHQATPSRKRPLPVAFARVAESTWMEPASHSKQTPQSKQKQPRIGIATPHQWQHPASQDSTTPAPKKVLSQSDPSDSKGLQGSSLRRTSIGSTLIDRPSHWGRSGGASGGSDARTADSSRQKQQNWQQNRRQQLMGGRGGGVQLAQTLKTPSRQMGTPIRPAPARSPHSSAKDVSFQPAFLASMTGAPHGDGMATQTQLENVCSDEEETTFFSAGSPAGSIRDEIDGNTHPRHWVPFNILSSSTPSSAGPAAGASNSGGSRTGRGAAKIGNGPSGQLLHRTKNRFEGDAARLQSGEFPPRKGHADLADPRSRCQIAVDVTVLRGEGGVIAAPAPGRISHISVFVHGVKWLRRPAPPPSYAVAVEALEGKAVIALMRPDTRRNLHPQPGSQLRVYDPLWWLQVCATGDSHYVQSAGVASSEGDHSKVDGVMLMTTELCELYPAEYTPLPELSDIAIREEKAKYDRDYTSHVQDLILERVIT